MNFRDRRGLMAAADHSLAHTTSDPRSLILIFMGVTAGVLLLVAGASFVLQSQIEGTGGLSGMAMRSMLETAIEVLQLGINLLLPFWTLGYLSCILKLTRGRNFEISNLLDGFRCFGPMLRLTLLRGGYLMLMAILCIYPSVMIFLWTPLSGNFQAIVEPLINQNTGEILLDEATLSVATDAMIPMFLIYGVILVLVAGPKFYSFRMADYCLLDNPKAGALAAIRRSSAMLSKNRLELLKLDLRFWWFYLLDGICVALCYSDIILNLLGIQLPFSPEVSYFLFYGLYLIAQLGLHYWARNRVECTYAAGYDCLNRDLEERIRQFQATQTP